MGRINDLNILYGVLKDLRERVEGYRYLRDCNGRTGWPDRGVYFFFENGETRSDGRDLRVTRVGTHAISATSQTTLWSRLRAHRGCSDGSGNHRGSIFRKRIGESLLRVNEYPQQLHNTWGTGKNAPKAVRLAENQLELHVSRCIGDMPFLWLATDDTAGGRGHRAYIERNCIALLSSFNKEPIDPASASWIGSLSPQSTIQKSGLWNTNHVTETHDPELLKVFANLISGRPL